MTAASPDSSVRLDTQKNRKLLLVSIAMASTGIGLFALGWSRDWGFVGMFWLGVLAFIGVGWVIGLSKGGGVAIADCPHCGARLEFTNIASARTVQCDNCGEWSAGLERMAPLASNHMAELPVFPTPLPEQPRWPTGEGGTPRCPTCGAPATRMIEVQATSALGDAFAALSPISVQRVHSLRVPACAFHDEGLMLDTGENDRDLVLLFASYAYYRDFLELNAQPAASAAQARADEPDQPQTLASFLADNPRPVDLRAPLTCPKHGDEVLTAMGWVTNMDVLPSHQWMESAVDYPLRLDIGHHRTRPEHGSHRRERIAWCPTCEAQWRR